jgi:hypothetical protein
MQGFAIPIEGYGKRMMTLPLYQHYTPVHKNYLQLLDPVGWTFNLLNTDYSIYRKPDNMNPPFQALIFLLGEDFFNQGGVITAKFCEDFFNDSLMPAIDTIATFKYKSARPVWSTQISYRTAQRWGNIMDLANL